MIRYTQFKDKRLKDSVWSRYQLSCSLCSKIIQVFVVLDYFCPDEFIVLRTIFLCRNRWSEIDVILTNNIKRNDN